MIERRHNKPKVGAFDSSTPHRFKPDTALGYRYEQIGKPECSYLHRWIINVGPFALRLHHWLASDDDRHLHDHPWWFLTLVLKGSYEDISHHPCADGWTIHPTYIEDGFCHCRGCGRNVTPDGMRLVEQMTPGTVRFRPALHRHTVRVRSGGAWTLLITGRKSRDWGFWVNGTWKRMRAYFREHGHHPCE